MQFMNLVGEPADVAKWGLLQAQYADKDPLEIIKGIADLFQESRQKSTLDLDKLSRLASVVDSDGVETHAAKGWPLFAGIQDSALVTAIAHAIVLFTFLQPFESVLPSKQEQTLRDKLEQQKKHYEVLIERVVVAVAMRSRPM